MENDFLIANWEKLTADLPIQKERYFQQLVQLYSSKNRHYHNLNHLQALLELLAQYRNQVASPKTVGLAIWYHDAIYTPSQKNNEEKSAELAEKHLTALGEDPTVISNCYKLILATKNHTVPDGLDTFDARFLLDIDLSILAAPRTAYLEYTRQIRREYNLYPSFLYRKGRKKVLEHFLNMTHIYKTQLFREQFEQQARDNIGYEILTLKRF